MFRKPARRWLVAVSTVSAVSLSAGPLPGVAAPVTAPAAFAQTASSARAAAAPAVSAACKAAQEAVARAKDANDQVNVQLRQDEADLRGLEAEIKRLQDEVDELEKEGVHLEWAIGDDINTADKVLGEAEKKLAEDIVDLPLDEGQGAVIESIAVKLDRAAAQVRRAKTMIALGRWTRATIFQREGKALLIQALYKFLGKPLLKVLEIVPVYVELGRLLPVMAELIFDDASMALLNDKLIADKAKIRDYQSGEINLKLEIEALQGEEKETAAALADARQKEASACKETESGGPLGTTWGDPHLVSFDGARFDFQQVGEFILARSNHDDFEIQVRERPWENSSLTIAENSAVAFKVGRDRVGIYVDSSGTGIRTLIDGKPVTLASNAPRQLAGGGKVINQTWDDQETVTWPDGAYVITDYSGGHYLTLNVSVPAAERGHLSGLLGNDDGNVDNDITTRGGKKLPYPPTAAELYGQFSDSWRISQSESLFDYAAGQSTKTFTDKNFPVQVVSVAGLPPSARKSATAICKAAGVTAEPFLDDCILDVALTGDPGTAAAAAAAQSFKSQPQGTITLTPASAGPDLAGQAQAFHVTATRTNGKPLAGVRVTLRITGANPITLHARTSKHGSASFSYTGRASGTDSAVASMQLGQLVFSSQPANVSWIRPQAAISTTEIHAIFFPNPNSTVDFEATKHEKPAISEVFPTIDFNPPGGTIKSPPPDFGVGVDTRPFTNVTLNNKGAFTGTIAAQGQSGKTPEQAGVNDLFNFYAAFTGSLIVAKAGNATFDFFSDDGFYIGIAGGATYVSGVDVNPPASGKTVFKGYRVVASFNQGSAPTGNTATIHFPKAGVYPFELDYTECCGGELSMTVANAKGLGLPPAGNLALSPVSPGPDPIGKSQSFSVSAVDASGHPLAGLRVELAITGLNGRTLTARTGKNGVASFKYTGAKAGTDQLQASATVTNGPEISNVVQLTWSNP